MYNFVSLLQRLRILSLSILCLTVSLCSCSAGAYSGTTSRTDEQSPTATAYLEATSLPEPTPHPLPTVAFNRKIMLYDLAQAVIIPKYQDFLAQSEQLEIVVHTFEQAPTEENLAALQDAWGAAAIAWKRCDLFGFRMTKVLHKQIYKTPVNDKFIEQFIADESVIDETFIDRVGSTSKGLGAIEYLIFDPAQSQTEIVAKLTTQAHSQQRRQYLVTAVENVHIKAQEIQALWSEPDGEYLERFLHANMDGSTIGSSLNTLTNEMVEFLNMTYKYEIGHPLGYFFRLGLPNFTEPDPTRVTAWRSGYSTELMISSFEGFSAVFNAADQMGYDDYLNSIQVDMAYEEEPLSDHINKQIDTIIRTLKDLNEPLDKAVLNNPDAVKLLHKQVRRLMNLIRVDMANNLNILILFSDSDGD